MKKFICILMFVVFFGINLCWSEVKVIPSVPHISQVWDMDMNEFRGYNACGPTSTVMITEFYHLQPANNSVYPGYWVYNSYGNAWKDKSGENYSTKPAKDWDPYNGNNPNPHTVYGAHGFIISEIGNDWKASELTIREYLTNHGLTLGPTVSSPSTSFYQTIKTNINLGLPLIAHSSIAGKGHYLVIVGYDTGVNCSEQKVVVNDPYGDANGNWYNVAFYGDYRTYPINGIAGTTRVVIDRVIPVYPIGIYNSFPGFKTNNTSQPFVTTFEKHSPKIGYPFSDNGGGVNVHEWKGTINTACSVLVQNFQGDLNAPHFGADGQSAIILNDLDLPIVANLAKKK